MNCRRELFGTEAEEKSTENEEMLKDEGSNLQISQMCTPRKVLFVKRRACVH